MSLQANPAVAMAADADALSKIPGSGLSNKIEDFYESVAHIKYGRKDPTSRAITVGSQFALGTIAINAAQFLGAPLALINQQWHDDWIAFNKQSWGLLITTMTNWWSPTLVRVSGGKSVRGQLHKTADGDLVCDFAERMVLIANHQIYTDWLYLWYIGYTNRMHGRIHVVLKESLKKIPVFGWGMTLSKFIFLKRDWEQDKAGLAKHLHSLNKSEDPMWLMFFPEGTNLASCTREKSRKWAEKNGIKDMQHLLLPRSTGLRFCLLNLRETVDYVYDCTIAYEGVKRGEFAQDIYPIQSSILSGRPPKSVNMYWRRFAIASIPLDDISAFDLWLRARWAEKDTLMEHYMSTGRFPADVGIDQTPSGEIRRGAGHIETQVKPHKWYEILQVFAPIASFIIVLFYFYNLKIPATLLGKLTEWANYGEEDIKKQLRVGPPPKLGKPKTISSTALKKTLKPPPLQSGKTTTTKAPTAANTKPNTPLSKAVVPVKPAMSLKATPKTLPTTKSTAAKPQTNPIKAVSASAQGSSSPKPQPKPTAPKKPSTAMTTPAASTVTKATSLAKPSVKPIKPVKPVTASKPSTAAKPAPKHLPKTQPAQKPKPASNTPQPSTKPAATTKPSASTVATQKTPAPKPKAATAPSQKASPQKAPAKEAPKKLPTTLPKPEPRRASTVTTTEGWSDTTAVEDPWAERPSGKRAVKAQPTRKDRVKLEKKMHRQHLERVAG
ncbi:MAG: hypothetical protein Q9191_002823 [Dirinaria sp. TL-2023a]